MAHSRIADVERPARRVQFTNPSLLQRQVALAHELDERVRHKDWLFGNDGIANDDKALAATF